MNEAPITIEVLYSCRVCGLMRVPVQVPARGEEDVVAWVEKVLTPALVADHKRRSFLCRPDTLSDVMIPVTGADKVGGAAKH